MDLHATFTRCYDQGGFSGQIDYCRDPPVPLSEESRRWLDKLLVEKRLRPSHEQVAQAAYALWEQEGRPHGKDVEHWHRALTQLRRGKVTGP